MTPVEQRRALLAQVHVAKKELGLEDDTYRAVLWEQCRVESAGKATVAQLEKLVKHFQAHGWKKKRSAKQGEGSGGPRNRQTPMMRALWAKVSTAPEDRREFALRAFVKRVVHVDAPEFCTPDQASRVIEALKAMLKRAGTPGRQDAGTPGAAP